MLVRTYVTCPSCSREHEIPAPYGGYFCDRCGKTIGTLCNTCKPKYRCSCGGRPIDKTEEWAFRNHILF